MADEQREPVQIARRKVRVRPQHYQPNRAELEEDVSVDATPEEIRDALMRSVQIVEDIDA